MRDINLVWHGHVGILMQEHLKLRKSMGLNVMCTTYILHQFNTFMKDNYPKLKLPNRHVILHFLHSKKHQALSGRKNVLVHIRQFCRFLNQRGISCYVPDKTLLPKLSYRPHYYPLTQIDVENLMSGLEGIRSKRPIVGETYSTMVGLLWCTGMRRSEVINLNHNDIDFEENIITIRTTKFYKSRMIPIDKTVAKKLKKYKDHKTRLGYTTKGDSPFFINLSGTRVRGNNLSHSFRRVTRYIGFRDENGTGVTIHDLRHNFATRSLKQFYSQDNYPTQTLLNILATYLGHTDMLYSQYYLHPDFDLLMKASERFENNKKAA